MTDTPNTDPFEKENESETPKLSLDDVLKDKLKSIVNDNGEQKYKTVEDALEALGHANNHIRTLEDERKKDRSTLQDLQGEIEKRASVEDVVKTLINREDPVPQQTKSENNNGLDEKAVSVLIQKEIENRNTQSVKESNYKTVVDTLSQKFGDKAIEVVKKKSQELGIEPTELADIARDKPQLVLGLFDTVSSQTTGNPSESTYSPQTSNKGPAERPTVKRSAARGGYTNKKLVEMFKESSDYTNKRLNVEE